MHRAIITIFRVLILIVRLKKLHSQNDIRKMTFAIFRPTRPRGRARGAAPARYSVFRVYYYLGFSHAAVTFTRTVTH